MTQTLPALLNSQPEAESSAASGQRQGYAFFNAQVMGQGGQRRGVRAGPLAIEAAQGAYLEREYSGPSDRRPAAGILTRTAV